MKTLLVSAFFFLGISLLFPVYVFAGNDGSGEAFLNNVDAVQAMAIANEWHWSKKEVTSFVTSREVVFKFSKDKVKMIPLPEDKMLVAVAPYIKRTHR
jgi:hypothetical protein